MVTLRAGVCTAVAACPTASAASAKATNVRRSSPKRSAPAETRAPAAAVAAIVGASPRNRNARRTTHEAKTPTTSTAAKTGTWGAMRETPAPTVAGKYEKPWASTTVRALKSNSSLSRRCAIPIISGPSPWGCALSAALASLLARACSSRASSARTWASVSFASSASASAGDRVSGTSGSAATADFLSAAKPALAQASSSTAAAKPLLMHATLVNGCRARYRTLVLEPFLQELQHQHFVPAQGGAALLAGAPHGRRLGHRFAHPVGIDQRRMHVVLAAHGARVPEALRDRIDRRDDVALRLPPARPLATAAQLHRREHGAAPGAEVLRAHVAAGDLLQVVVDVVRGNQVALAGLVAVLEELLPRQVLAALDDAREARVGDRDAVLDAALAAEGEAQHRAVDREVPAPERGQAIRAIVAHVFVVPHPDERAIEQAHDRGEDLAPAEIGGAQVALDTVAKPWQHLAEFEHALEFRAVARLAVLRVIPVLLAPARIARGRLDVAVGIRADPHVAPRRRNGEAVQPFRDAVIGDAAAARMKVNPAFARAVAPDAVDAIGDVAQSRAARARPVLRG